MKMGKMHFVGNLKLTECSRIKARKRLRKKLSRQGFSSLASVKYEGVLVMAPEKLDIYNFLLVASKETFAAALTVFVLFCRKSSKSPSGLRAFLRHNSSVRQRSSQFPKLNIS